jgi:hypothetical protein
MTSRSTVPPPMTINKNKLHATLCIAASAAVSISFFAWAIGTLI